MKYLLLFSLLIEELIHNFQNIWLGGHVRSEAAALLTQCCAGSLNQASGQPLPALPCFPGVQLGGGVQGGLHFKPHRSEEPLEARRRNVSITAREIQASIWHHTDVHIYTLDQRLSHLPLPFLLNWQRVRFCTWFTDVH